jgi:hypothetical protein
MLFFWQFQTQNPLLELPKTSLASQIDRLLESGTHGVPVRGGGCAGGSGSARFFCCRWTCCASIEDERLFSARSAISLIVFFSKVRLVFSSASRPDILAFERVEF